MRIKRSIARRRDRVSASIQLAVDARMAPHVHTAVLISGFFRSGTTWLQQFVAQALGAKTVFEPMSPPTGHRWPHQVADDMQALQSYLPLGPEDLDDHARAVLLDASRGFGRSAFSLKARARKRRALRRTVVVKHVRAGVILPDLLAWRPMPTLCIRRHPAAVYRSLCRVRWRWSYDRVRYRDTFARSPDSPARDLLLAHDTDGLERFAAAWALSERGAQQVVDDGRALLVRYEEAVARPRAVFDALSALGLPIVDPRPFTADSATTKGARGREAWRQDLSEADLRRLETVTTAIWPAAEAVWHP
jgi:hypothetical protein